MGNAISHARKQRVPKNSQFTLRPYQKDAVHAIIDMLDELNNRKQFERKGSEIDTEAKFLETSGKPFATLSMACGTGKTDVCARYPQNNVRASHKKQTCVGVDRP